MNFRFPNRNEAGRYLAEELMRFAGRPDVVVIALARGGVPVGYEIARMLNTPLDIFVAGRLGGPEAGEEWKSQETEYRNGRAAVDIAGLTVILADDGFARGDRMRAAVRTLRQRDPARIIVAVPVGAADACCQLQNESDEVICAQRPHDLGEVGFWYEDFSQTRDEEIIELLDRLAAMTL